MFLHAMRFKLFRERLVGEARLAEEHDTRSVLVEPVQDREVRPARVARLQPLVQPVGREAIGFVRVDAGGLVDGQQMFVLEKNEAVHESDFLSRRILRQ